MGMNVNLMEQIYGAMVALPHPCVYSPHEQFRCRPSSNHTCALGLVNNFNEVR